jgi:hypothetical protein
MVSYPTAVTNYQTANPMLIPTKTCRGLVGFMWVLGAAGDLICICLNGRSFTTAFR